jgi:hypothetical protein
MFNTWASNVKQKFRFFPLKNKDGSVVPNAYVFTAEDFDGTAPILRQQRRRRRHSQRSADGVGPGDRQREPGPRPARPQAPRLQPHPAAAADHHDLTTGEEIVLPNNVVHNKARVRIFNSGNAPMTISSVVLSNTKDFQINTTGLNGKDASAGTSTDIEVEFIATTAATAQAR